MIKDNRILEYLINEYNPSSIIIYGSFADETNDERSDFDALVISNDSYKKHDDSVIDTTELDVFIYSKGYFLDKDKYDVREFLQIQNGLLLLDRDGMGAKLLQDVESYITKYEPKSITEKQTEISWCKKMLQRIERGNTEGLYRWHWLLVDSLEIYFDLKDQMYLGPKKSLDLLYRYDKKGFEIYNEALSIREVNSLRKWIHYLEQSANLVL